MEGDMVDLSTHPPYRPSMERRRFLLTSPAGALAAPLATESGLEACGQCGRFVVRGRDGKLKSGGAGQ